MRFKPVRMILISLLLLGTTLATVAQAQVGGGENAGSLMQSPVQVMVQIVVSAIVLRVLNQFNLP